MEVFRPYQFKNYQEVIKADQKWDAFFMLPNQNQITELEPHLYPDIELEALQTSYNDYYQIIMDLKEDHVLCDLGAGYGRGSFLANQLNFENVYSVELSQERIQAAWNSCEKLGISKNYFIQADILEIDLSKFDAFYLYFPKNPMFLKLFKKLKTYNREFTFYVTESHGDMIPFLSHLSFLTEVGEFACSLPRHEDKIKKYKFSPHWADSLINNLLEKWGDEVYLSYKYQHQILKEEVTWLIDASKCDLHFFSEFELEVLDFGRRLPLTSLQREGVSEFEKNNLCESLKLLRTFKGLVVEDRLGRIRPL